MMRQSRWHVAADPVEDWLPSVGTALAVKTPDFGGKRVGDGLGLVAYSAKEHAKLAAVRAREGTAQRSNDHS
jgi:hypothetical protein